MYHNHSKTLSLLTSTPLLLGFFITSCLVASVPTLTSSKNTFALGVKGANDKIAGSSDSFFLGDFCTVFTRRTGENYNSNHS